MKVIYKSEVIPAAGYTGMEQKNFNVLCIIDIPQKRDCPVYLYLK